MKKPKIKYRSRFLFARRIGLAIVVSHVVLVLMLAGLAVIETEEHKQEGLWTLFQISVPLTAAYFTSVLVWFTVTPSKEELGGKIDSIAATGIGLAFIAFLVALFIIPIAYIFYGGFVIETAKVFYSSLELAFGSGLGFVARELFKSGKAEQAQPGA